MKAELPTEGALSREELLQLVQGGGPEWKPEYSTGDPDDYMSGFLWAGLLFLRVAGVMSIPGIIHVFLSTNGQPGWCVWVWTLWNVWNVYDVIHRVYRHFRPVPLCAEQIAAADALTWAREKYFRQRKLYKMARKTKHECDYARSIGFPHQCVFCGPK